MTAVYSLGLGYAIGCISPAAWLGKKKNVNLKEEGTKNLGATNTALVLGKAAGIFVMLFDIAKSFFSYKLAKWLFPHLVAAGIFACIGCILGHCFPVTMGFQGGKGLAAFGGMILAYNPLYFFLLASSGVVLMLIFNTGVVVPMLAGAAFPILVYRDHAVMLETLAAGISSAIIIATHWENLKRAKQKNDVVKVREFFIKVFGKK